MVSFKCANSSKLDLNVVLYFSDMSSCVRLSSVVCRL